MTVPRKAVVVSITLFVLAGLALIFFSAGGFEKYEEPIQIIVPRSVNGVLCFKLVPLMVGDKLSAQSKLLISDDGYLSISSGLIQDRKSVV